MFIARFSTGIRMSETDDKRCSKPKHLIRYQDSGIEGKADSQLPELAFRATCPSCMVDGHRGIESMEVVVYRSLALRGAAHSCTPMRNAKGLGPDGSLKRQENGESITRGSKKKS